MTADVITLPVIRIERYNATEENPMAKANGHDDGTEKATAAETREMIPAKQLRQLLRTMESGKKQQVTIAGNVGSEVKTAIERYGVNRKVLAVIHKLDMMEAEDIRDFLDEFEYMCDAAGINKRAESAPRLPTSTDGDEARA